MRYLSIDHGESRIGLALCDAGEIAIRPIEAISGKDTAKAVAMIMHLIETHKIQGIILGIPMNENGTMSKQAEIVQKFGKHLQRVANIQPVYWNEYYTTQIAEELAGTTSRSKKRKKEMSDSFAAMVILKEYIDFKNEQTGK